MDLAAAAGVGARALPYPTPTAPPRPLTAISLLPTLYLEADGPEATGEVRPPTPAHSSGTRRGEIEAKDGLPSADRNNKATLLLTGPFRTAKSSAKDLTPLVLKLQYAKYRGALRAPRRNRLLRR